MAHLAAPDVAIIEASASTIAMKTTHHRNILIRGIEDFSTGPETRFVRGSAMKMQSVAAGGTNAVMSEPIAVNSTVGRMLDTGPWPPSSGKGLR
jgi:hypothetical protein